MSVGEKKKALVRQARCDPSQVGIYLAQEAEQSPSITEEKALSNHHPHNDALVVIIDIDHVPIHQVLVDGGSSTNILSLKALKAVDWDKEKLKRCAGLLVGFSGERVYPKGSIKLPIKLGQGEASVTRIEEFVVINRPTVYNAILGRPAIHGF